MWFTILQANRSHQVICGWAGWLPSRSVRTDLFDYELPSAAIAQVPVEPRDSARLLRVEPRQNRIFAELPGLLRPHDLLVVNPTKVRSARLRGRKKGSGGAVEILLVRRIDSERWEALVRPSRRIRVGTVIDCGPVTGEVLTAPDRGEVVLALWSATEDVEDVLPAAGEVPLPPYITVPLQNPERYQTVFAETIGSAAAPTAALHFTPQLVQDLEDGGTTIAEVELEVGLDTFRPIATESINDHKMHRESWVVPEATAAAIAATRKRQGRVVAVGTTVVRTLESAASGAGEVAAGRGDTELFIAPGYQLQVVDVVLTNFHAPRTTLIVMIAALLGDRWREVYAYALDHDYRFLSFGDAMLIENPVNRG